MIRVQYATHHNYKIGFNGLKDEPSFDMNDDDLDDRRRLRLQKKKINLKTRPRFPKQTSLLSEKQRRSK